MAKETKEPDLKSAVGGVREALSGFVGSQVERLAEKAGDKLTDVTGQLTDAADNGGSLLKIGSRILGGESPVKAFLSEKAKGVKDSVVDKAKEAFGGGKGKSGGGGKSMNILEVLDVGVSLRTAYDYWTQYEKFSSFTKGVRSVSKSDETASDWKVKVGPSSRSFTATVQEQIPDDRIVWTSEGAKGSTKGAVSFHELAPELTRIVLVMEYYPSGFFEKTGNLWRAQGRRVRLDFKHFQRYVTLADEEPEGWRGEIRDGEVVMSHEEALEEEEATQAEDSEDDDAYESVDDEDGATEDEDEEDEAVEEAESEDEDEDGDGGEDGDEGEGEEGRGRGR
ncbi:SRPBCC family protein [Streptomyces sp. NPDC058423]|uniref:SRPBCC family protein n=1 Tax=unclassified Streptomyces TaxID=2593676 RepID=UPI0036530587